MTIFKSESENKKEWVCSLDGKEREESVTFRVKMILINQDQGYNTNLASKLFLSFPNI